MILNFCAKCRGIRLSIVGRKIIPYYYVVCRGCGRVSHGYGETEEEAVELWNKKNHNIKEIVYAKK